MKLLRRLSIVVVIAITGCAASWYWLLHTNSGAEWLIARVELATEGAFGARSVDGDLASGLDLDGISYTSAGLEATAASLRLAIDVDLLPLSVEIVSARIETVGLVISETPGSEAKPLDVPELLRKLQLPLELRISDLVAEGLAIESPGFKHTVSLLELKARWQDAIVVDWLRADGEGIHIEGDASFDLTSDLLHVGNLVLRLDPELTGHTETINIGVRSEGGPDRLGLRIDVENVAAVAHAEIRRLFEEPVWDIDVTVPHYRWPLQDGDESVEIHDLNVSSTGRLAAWSLDVSGDVDAPGLRRLSVGVTGDGNTDGFRAESLRAEGADLAVTGAATVVWAADRMLETSLAIARLDPRFLLPDWPEAYPIEGAVTASLDEEGLKISESRLVVPRVGAELQVQGDIDQVDRSVLGVMRWTNLRWPLDGDVYDIKSDYADVRVGGTFDAWSVNGTIELGARDMPEGIFTIDGNGDRDAARISVLEAQVLGGTLEGELEYSWRGAKPWRGQLNVATIETGPLIPEWPGRVSGRIDVSGQTEPLALSAELTDVTGTLRGAALQASGGFSFATNKLLVNDLHATHGLSVFKANGGTEEASGLAFEISIPDIGDYVAALSGDLKSSGVVRTTPGQSYLSLTADATELRYGNVLISDLRIDDVRTQEQMAGLKLAATQIIVGDREFPDITAVLEATMTRQSLAVSGDYRDSRLSLSLEGAVEDWSAPLTAGWRGVLRTLEVAPDDQHVARLLSPAELFVSATKFEIAEACVGPDPNASICAAGDWAASGAYNASARFRNVPVDLVNFAVDTGLAFDEVVNGELGWSYLPAIGPSGFGQLSMTAGRISSIENPRLTLATGEGVLNFRVADNRLLNATLGLPLPGTGEINGYVRLHDLELNDRSQVSGGIVADVAEIAVLASLIPAIDTASGRLHLDVGVTGSIGTPLLRGNLTLADGSVAVDSLGLLLEDLSLSAKMIENYRVEFDGDFRSGEGHGTVTALVDYRDIDDPYLRVAFKGEQLALINVEDIRAAANPDFELVLTGKTLSIDGSVHIPEALVAPVNLTVPQAYESPDVVIVAGELPDLPEVNRSEGLRYSGTIDVSLGDKVIVDLDVAQASLQGKVTFDWRGDSMPYANGRYKVVGTVSAFGQVLDISNGSVRFPDVPANNPVVRIRAEREIYGNTQVKRAGVLVDGTVTALRVEPYTQPETTGERALTLLVTGSDFDFEQGVGAIDFGTYISPRLFVSYGIGVFERDNIVSARFDLSKAFGIKASSGDKETGIDLNYRFEN